MLQQKSGKIVNISSIRGIDHCGREGVMDYSASKTAVIGLTKTMAKELAPYINVNTVAPGHTKTEMTAPLPDEIKQNMIEGLISQTHGGTRGHCQSHPIHGIR